MKPYYEDGSVTIYHGDALELLPTLAPGSVHLCATDPPYFRVVEAEWDDQWGADVSAFLAWLGSVLDLVNDAMDDRATLGVFCFPDASCGVELEVRKRFAYLNHIVWRKPGPGRLGAADKDSLRRFFPLSERIILAEKCRNPDGDLFRFRDHVNHAVARDVYAEIRLRLVALRDAAKLTNRDVDVALGRNGMASHYFGASQWSLPNEAAWGVIAPMLEERGVKAPSHAELRQEFDSRRREFDSRRREFDSRRREFDSRRDREIELLSDVWTFDTVPAQQRVGGHPTQKPLPLMAHIIGTMSRPGDLVLDPFAGTGTTLRAAKDLGRRAIGIEAEERWCEVAANRCAQEVLPL